MKLRKPASSPTAVPAKSSWLKRIAPDWLTLVSGALIVFAFPPWNLYPLIWIAIIPWLAALKRAPSGRQAFIQGVWLSVVMSLGGFYWVAHVVQEFGNLPESVSLALLALFSLTGQSQFYVFAPLWRWLRRDPRHRGITWALAVALLYAAVDWVVPKLFVDTFGHSQYLAKNLRQVADLGGAQLLTFLIFLVNESAYAMIAQLRARREPSLWPAIRAAGGPLGIALALLAGAWFYGHARGAQIRELQAHPRSFLQAAVIQANIGDFDKLASERGVSGAADRVLDTFFTLSDQALTHQPRPQVIIWPETSYPSTFRTPSNAMEMERDHRVENFVRSRQVPVLFGGYDHANGKDFNAFFFLSPQAQAGVDNGSDLQIYRKNMLLLFGEYIPFAEDFAYIRDTFPQVGNFGHGVGPSVLTIPVGGRPEEVVRTGPIICYEALFPDYVIAAARKGSQMILNITNDSWFGSSGEPILHLSLTTFRSIETHLPQLRSTNTGISTLILPDGEITSPTQVDTSDILYASVPILDPIWTLMKAWGDWFGRTACVLSVLGIAALLWAERKRV